MVEWIRVPLVNANEDEVEITALFVVEGQEIQKGTALFEVESTKATIEVEAPHQGFVRGIRLEEGQRAKVGMVFCALTEAADTPLPELPEQNGRAGEDDGPRATRRARLLAAEYDLELAKVPHRGIVTERDVLDVLQKTAGDLRAPADRSALNGGGERPGEAVRTKQSVPVGGAAEAIVIYGAGGHARVVLDAIREGRRDLQVVGILDDGEDRPDEVLGVPVLGSAELLPELRERGIRCAALGIGAVTHNRLRAELFERLKSLGFRLPAIIHPRASVEPSAFIGAGTQIFAGAVVGSTVEIGENVIVNSNVVVSHDSRVGDHVHLTPGALLAGNVEVGPRSVIGMGVTIYLGVRIGADVTIANGNHIVQDVEEERFIRLV